MYSQRYNLRRSEIADRMTNVFFCKNSEIEDECLKYAVIVSEYKNKWIFCRHKERSTWEIPGGHREPGEEIETTARRELAEETGATLADIRQVSVYGVEKDEKISYGMLFCANIKILGQLSECSEISEIGLFDTLPEKLTYPDIQPHLFNKIQTWLGGQSLY